MTARRWAVFFCAATGTFLGSLDLNIVPVAFTSIRHSFSGAPLAEMSWVTTGYATAFAAALLPAGALADRLGRAPVFLAGLATFVAASAACALAPTAVVLIGARLVQGFGAGTLTPLALALILSAFPDARGRAIGLWAATASAAATAGPALGGLLIGVSGWRLCFSIAVPVGLAALSTGWRALDLRRPAPTISALAVPVAAVPAPGISVPTVPAEPQPVTAAGPDLLGALLLALSIGLGVLAVSQAVPWGWDSPTTAGVLLAAVTAGAAFVARSRRHPTPLIRPGLLASPPVRTANLILLLFGTVYFAIQLANALYLTGVAGYSAHTAGLALTPGAMAGTVASYLAGVASGKYGYRRVAATGTIAVAAGCLILAVSTVAGASYVTGVLPGLVLASGGGGAAFTALAGAAVAAVPANELGMGTSLSVTSRAIGGALGFAALAALLQAEPDRPRTAHHTVWFAAAAGAALTAAATALLATRPVRASAPRPP